MTVTKVTESMMMLETTILERIDSVKYIFLIMGIVFLYAMLESSLPSTIVGLCLGAYGLWVIACGTRKVVIRKDKQELTVTDNTFVLYAGKRSVALNDVNDVFVEFHKGTKWQHGKYSRSEFWELVLHIRDEAYGNRIFFIERTNNRLQVEAVARRIGDYLGKQVIMSK